MNELEQGGEFNDALKRRYGIIGNAPAGVLASELFPTIGMGDHELAPELRFLAHSRLSAISIDSAAGGVGNFTIVGIQNPANSGVIAVVTHVSAWQASSAANLELRLSDVVTSGPDNTYDATSLDSRWPFARVPALNGFDIAAAAQIGREIWDSYPLVSSLQGYVEVPVWQMGGIVMAPGSQINVSWEVANLELTANFAWRERRIAPLELGG